MRKATLLKAVSVVRWTGAAVLAGLLCGMEWGAGGKAITFLFFMIGGTELLGTVIACESLQVWPTDLVFDNISRRMDCRNQIRMHDVLLWLIFLPGDILMVPLRILRHCVSAAICDLEE